MLTARLSRTELLSSRTQRSRPWLFRTLLTLLLVALPQAKTHAAVLFYEGFDYPVGQELGQTIITSGRWENDKNQFIVASGNLDYHGIKTPVGNHLRVTVTSPSIDSVRTVPGAWDAQSTGALYLSFLLRVQSARGINTTNGGTPILTLSKASNNTQLLGINLLNSDGLKLGVVKYPSSSIPVSSTFFSSGVGANLSTNSSDAYLIVAKYEWVPGADNDVVSLWVNPTVGHDEQSENKIATSAGTDGSQSAGRLTLCRGPDLNIDEIRIGQSWSEVTPENNPKPLAKD